MSSSKPSLSPANRKWLPEVKACEKSGETLRSCAERNGVPVTALYQAKKRARELGLLPPHRDGNAAPRPTRQSRTPLFVEAIQRAESRERTASWRVRFPSGAVFESSAPLSVEDALLLIESLEGRS
jgi:hypothetical protein